MKKIGLGLLMISLLSIASVAFAASTKELQWTRIEKQQSWGGRLGHSSVVFNDEMWILGGMGEREIYYNDIWHSADGMDWKKVERSTDWSPRYGHSSVVFDNKIWVIGGFGEGQALLNDVWYSKNGENWTKVDSLTPWLPRAFHQSLVFDNKIWVIGGEGQYGARYNDIWYSEDGAHWNKADDKSVRWEAREGHAATVFDGKMWVMGGMGENGIHLKDLWYSENGSDWTKVTFNNFLYEYGHSLVQYKDKLWDFGGFGDYFSNHPNPVIYSTNGNDWDVDGQNTPWTARVFQSTLVFKGKIWMLGGGGENESYLNEIWVAMSGNEDSIPAVSNEDKTPPEPPSVLPDKAPIEKVFIDVPVDSPYDAAIRRLNDLKIIGGYPDGTFKPGNSINRAEFMKIVVGASGYVVSGKNCFPDVKTEWFSAYVCTGANNNIVKGYPDGMFRPSQNINVVEALKMILNAFRVELPLAQGAWYEPYVDYAKAHNLFLDSFVDNTKYITREEMAELIYRIMQENQSPLALFVPNQKHK